MEEYKISVIVPCYNTENYLEECLNSVLTQTLQEIEVICVDDCSTDTTAEMLKKYAAGDVRVKTIFFQTNQGSGPARNAAMKQARGKYIAFMDPDDLYPDANVLAALYAKAEENEALICGGNMQMFKPGETPVYWGATDVFKTEGFADFASYKFIAGFPRFIYRADFLKKSGADFPPYRRRQDPVFLAKAMSVAGRFYMVPIVSYLYRRSYKKVSWNYEKYLGAVLSFKDCFEIYRQKSYWRHMAEEISDLQHFYRKIKFDNSLTNEEKNKLYEIVHQAETLIDYQQVRQYDKKIQKLDKLPVFFKNKQADGTREFYLFGKKIFSCKKHLQKIKLGVSYNLFDGEELLADSIRAIRSEVDYVNVVYQDVSNFGNPAETDLAAFLADLQKQGLVDEIVKYEPDLKKKASYNERQKRNLGLKYAAKRKCTHFISMDTDELYQAAQLRRAKEYLAGRGKKADATLVGIYAYVQKPTYRIVEPVDGYVSFIVKIKRGICLGRRNPFYPAITDPTRVIGGAKKFWVFPREIVVMHHMAYVRKDLHKKYKNSSFNDSPKTAYQTRLERIMAVENFKLGDTFEGKQVCQVENMFNIKDWSCGTE